MAYNRVSSFGSTDSGYESSRVEEPAPRPVFKYHEQSKELARQRQHMLASELSRLDAEEYEDDMLEHMLRMEQETLADVDSIDIQTEIQWFMRPYLLDFLVEAHSAFQLLPETLFLTLNLLDRYCSKRVVYKRHYQLVGCAALLIAAKYGDKKEKVPTIKELKSMCCSLYDDDMFLQMEWHVLSTLGWIIGHPTVDNFVQMAIKDTGIYDPEVENMTLYILEIALYHRDFVSKRSSVLALSALALARHILGRPQPRQSSFAASFDNGTFLELSQKLHDPSAILSRKYASARYSCVSRLLSSILAQKATAQVTAAQMPLTPTCETSTVTKTSQPAYFQTYSTPQKPQLPAVVAHGMYTPPITPDTEQNMFGTTSKTFSASSRFAPPTPSPSNAQQYSQFTFKTEQQQPPPPPQPSSSTHRWPVETY